MFTEAPIWGCEKSVGTLRLCQATFTNHPDIKKPKLLPAQAAVQRRLRQAKLQKLTGWDDDPNQSAGLRIVILKRMFHRDESKGDPNFYEDLERDIGLECQRVGGPIEKLTVFKVGDWR